MKKRESQNIDLEHKIFQRLIDLGIMVKYSAIECVNTKGLPSFTIPERWDISLEYKDKVYKQVKEIIDRNTRSTAEWEYKKIALKINQLPGDLKKQSYLKVIYSKINGQCEYFMSMDTESKKEMIQHYFTHEDYLKHYEGKLIILHNELVLSHIESEANILLIQLLNNEYSNLSKGATKKILKQCSYKWQNPETELPLLFNKMKNVFIDKETTLEQFKSVFTEQSNEISTPIKWIHSNRLLAYFLDESFKGQDWQSIAGNGKLFLNKKNKILTANDLSVAKKEYASYGSPKDHDQIDLILKEIKNIKNTKTS